VVAAAAGFGGCCWFCAGVIAGCVFTVSFYSSHTTQHVNPTSSTPPHPTPTPPKVLKTNSLVSSVFFMCLPDKVLVYGDCAVNVSPTSKVCVCGVGGEEGGVFVVCVWGVGGEGGGVCVLCVRVCVSWPVKGVETACLPAAPLPPTTPTTPPTLHSHPHPPPQQDLAQIAATSADTAAAFGLEPRVAMLSYSTLGSGAGPDVQKVRGGGLVSL